MQKSKRYLALSLAVVILLVFGASLYINRNNPTTAALASEITMEPTKQDSAGADSDTAFILSAKSALDPRFIRENLSVEPAVDFTVARDSKDKQKVLVTPKAPLEPQKIYKFTLSIDDETPLKWAFQTKGDFKVVSTLPHHQATGVPTNTGIEINFSHLNFDKLSEFFTISPNVEGSFEVHKKTAVFVPKSLEPDTLYTVTVKKGMPLSSSRQTLKEDFTFQFETQEESQDGLGFNFHKSISEFSTSEKPIFQFGYYSWDSMQLPKNIDFTVYRYKTANDYIRALQEKQKIPFWAFRSRQTYLEDVSKLQSVAKFSAPVMDVESTKFIEFPEVMPAGYYIAQANVQNNIRQIWFQVTDLAIYAAVGKNQNLVWVNDLSSGKPVSGAKVQFYGNGKSSTTDDTGLAKLSTSNDAVDGVYAVVSKDNREAVAAIYPYYQMYPDTELEDDFAKDYWKYLYLDRTLYKPDSTVNFWGIIKPRADKTKNIDKVTVSLLSSELRDNPTIDSKEIPLDDFSFIGNMKLPNLTPGYYFLEVKCEDLVITSRGFEVATYSKPSYQLEVVPSKKAVYVGDKVDFQVKAAFFEGTPVPDTPLEYYIRNYGNGSTTTDSEGNAIISFSPEFKQEQYGFLQHSCLFLTAKLPEAGEIETETALFVLNNDICIDASGDVKNGTAAIEIDIDRLTIDKVNSGQADPWDEDAYKSGPAANHPVNVRIYRDVWEKYEAGKYYDFINKKVQTRYEYEYSKVLESETQVTTDKEGKATFTFPVKNEESYRVELTAIDFKGNPAVYEYTISGNGRPRIYDYTWYYLEGKALYKTNEAVELSMKQNESPISSRPNGFLFFTAQNGILESCVQDTADFNTAFKQELIPNFWVKGVYFDGRNYHEAYEFIVMYDRTEKALNIDIKTDQKEYNPKDTVNVEVEVTDSSGRPVEALVNLNLVDEALYALRQQYADILGDIYGDIYGSGIYITGFTHETADSLSGGAEGGGEGGSERKDFKDAVLFKTVSTDRQGKAKFSFKVPDNLTSWRLTCQAVTDDLFAATKTAPVIVKLPFFVSTVINDTYLTGDQPMIPLRAFGNKLKSGTSISYETALKGPGKTISETLTKNAFDAAYWQLPALQKGKYDLTVTGKTADGLTDKLTLSFNVVDSLVTKQQVDFWLMEENLQIKGAENTPTSLTFTDYERSQYLRMLLKLSWSDGSRIDQKIAPLKAQSLLEEYFPDLNLALPGKSGENLNLLEYQTQEGGIAVLPYSDQDLELSAKLVSLYGSVFDKSSLADYFYKIAEDPKESRERSIIALYGLSALNEPVLTELKLLSTQKDLTVKEQLYLAMAFLEIGDEPSASQWIKSILKQNGEDLKTQMRIKCGQDQDDILEATALASIVCAGLNLDEQNKLAAYVLDNSTKDILLYAEQLMFLEKALPRLSKNAVSFDYRVDGKSEKVVLEPQETFCLLLSPEKLAKLKFENIKGKVGITAVYPAAFDTSLVSITDGVKLTRSYEAVSGRAQTSFNAGDLIKVNIAYEFGQTAPDGPYIITDFLPAGLKIVERPHYHGAGNDYTRYPVQVDGQKVIFAVYEKKNRNLNYYARVINPGEFAAEPAIIQHMSSGVVYSVTKGDRMSIK